MENSYEAPDVSLISAIGSFVLGEKFWGVLEWDSVIGWGYGWNYANDIDEADDC